MIELYYAAPSIYGRKVLAVLDEKNLDYTIKNMAWGDNKKEDYLKLNPNGEFPMFFRRGKINGNIWICLRSNANRKMGL